MLMHMAMAMATHALPCTANTGVSDGGSYVRVEVGVKYFRNQGMNRESKSYGRVTDTAALLTQITPPHRWLIKTAPAPAHLAKGVADRLSWAGYN
jgi:hypothetical protein